MIPSRWQHLGQHLPELNLRIQASFDVEQNRCYFGKSKLKVEEDMENRGLLSVPFPDIVVAEA